MNKRFLEEEEKKLLKDIQKAMDTDDTLGTRKPVLWMVYDYDRDKDTSGAACTVSVNLTKKGAQDFLKRFGYRYGKDSYISAEHVFPGSEMELFLNIFSDLNIDSIF